ncbi:hypothetical protein GQ55_2G379700 [Panicum hallii var. hallii]|uniref:At1g61320/AtMIF1 LRR domain-containing protein n=1 Tax=Panicum hallii var. hallii TaxID=1504633 RepID=A0A2T7EWQ2_9POAL|nr:hypothetical protein GQ55_2G379700 [Panicum hallii var. hallii]
MELNNGQSQRGEDEDRFSMLSDDFLLSILARVSITTAARTSVLSTRSFLGTPQSEATISRLQLELYLINNYSDVVGPLLGEAIDFGTLKDLDLAFVDEEEPADCNDEHMLHQASVVDGFFSAYPSVIHCLTRLSLDYVCFAKWDMHHLLFDCCKQLQSLLLTNSPDSHLAVLELQTCCFGKLEVLHLPKLERLCWDGWICSNAPLSLGVVPSLTELHLICAATDVFQGFKLSDVLRDTTTLHNLTLSFQGEKLWLQPEGEQLCTVFNKLRKLSLHYIFVDFDLLWTIVLLEAAPSVEIFEVEVWEHPCIVDDEERRQNYSERINPSWKVDEFATHEEWLLKELQVIGFAPMEQQLTFIRTVMNRAPNLRTLVLKDYPSCEDCEEIGALPHSERLPKEHEFPKGTDEKDVVVKQLVGEIASPHLQMIFVDQ